jgi:hypothetical protein
MKIKKILAFFVVLAVMAPSLVHATNWFQAAASGMGDVAVAPDGKIWLAGRNGTIWTSAHGVTFMQDEKASGFESVAAGWEGAWI